MIKSSGRIWLERDPDVDALVFGMVPVLELPEATAEANSSLESLATDEVVETSMLSVESLLDILFGVKLEIFYQTMKLNVGRSRLSYPTEYSAQTEARLSLLISIFCLAPSVSVIDVGMVLDCDSAMTNQIIY